jgi:hypothetical protein
MYVLFSIAEVEGVGSTGVSISFGITVYLCEYSLLATEKDRDGRDEGREGEGGEEGVEKRASGKQVD